MRAADLVRQPQELLLSVERPTVRLQLRLRGHQMTATRSPRLAPLHHCPDLAEDDAVRGLTPEARRRLGRLWRRRAENELATSRAFAQLDHDLRLFGAPSEVLELSARAVDDEVFHAALCARASEIYGEETRPLVGPPEPPRPSFPVCSPRVHGALFAALHSAVNETIGVTYLSACFAEAQGRAAHRVVKELLSDEVRHSRIGWAVLASPQLDTQARATIASFMPALLDVCVGAWLADIETDYPRDLPRGHGCINHVGIAQAVRDALHGVILPGLDHVGIDATAARQWVAQSRT
jgi:hypothetical protein